jgi:hypothetical protein
VLGNCFVGRQFYCLKPNQVEVIRLSNWTMIIENWNVLCRLDCDGLIYVGFCACSITVLSGGGSGVTSPNNKSTGFISIVVRWIQLKVGNPVVVCACSRG